MMIRFRAGDRRLPPLRGGLEVVSRHLRQLRCLLWGEEGVEDEHWRILVHEARLWLTRAMGWIGLG